MSDSERHRDMTEQLSTSRVAQDRTLPPGPQASVTLTSQGSCGCCYHSHANPQGPSASSGKEVLIRIFLRNAMTIVKCMIQTLVSPVIPRVLHQKIRLISRLYLEASKAICMPPSVSPKQRIQVTLVNKKGRE